MVFLALMTSMILCARSQDSLLPVSVRRYMSYSRLLDLRAKEDCVIELAKPPAAERHLASLAHLEEIEAKPPVD